MYQNMAARRRLAFREIENELEVEDAEASDSSDNEGMVVNNQSTTSSSDNESTEEVRNMIYKVVCRSCKGW